MSEVHALKFFTALILSATFILSTLITPAQAAGKKIIVNVASRLMLFFDGDTKVAVYNLGLGKVSTPTPTGYYKITEKEINPTWIDPSDPEHEIPSGSDNPLGYRWMQFSGNYGIHGTNRPESIGGYVSNGCIRMNERDVEELFDAVEVGTPVEIMYNRIVVEKAPSDDVVYYIYPDGYGLQVINVADVVKWLEPFGVLAFESENDIAQKIAASDGEPTYIGKPYNVEINGELIQPTDDHGIRFFAKAVLREGITYLPVVPITKALRTKLAWNKSESSLESHFGKVVCYEKKDQLYCNADDAMVLFNIEGGLQTAADGSKVFRFKSLPAPEPSTPAKPSKPSKPDKPSTEPPTTQPSDKPSTEPPTTQPSDKPSTEPLTTQPSDKPSTEPPTAQPSDKPSTEPPTAQPSDKPSTEPPTTQPTDESTDESSKKSKRKKTPKTVSKPFEVENSRQDKREAEV